jgi:hypothetical protein
MTYHPENLSAVPGETMLSYQTVPTHQPQPVQPVQPAGEEEYEEELSEEGIPMAVAEPNSEDDDFSDVTGLSEEDEEELFDLDNSEGEDPTGQDDDLSDVLEISPKDNEELFGTGPVEPKRKKLRHHARQYTTPAGVISRVQY